MHIVKDNTNIDFMGKRKLAMVVSAALVLIAVISLALRGLNFGIDFTGGTLVEIAYPQNVELNEVRQALSDAGYKNLVVQHFGTSRDVLIRLAPQEGMTQSELSDRVVQILRTSTDANLELRRVEFVGPQVGEELANQGGLALLVALFGILIYVTLRFEWRFSVGSVIALIHDVLITLGLFSLLQLDFDLSVLAALLAVIGYSLNDTIVVFDRIRENFRKMRKGTSQIIINTSINQTLSRTVMTSLTTLVVLLALFFLGGEVINHFALALIIGVLVGTYSSIFVASSAVLSLGISKTDLMPVKKEGAELDRMP